MIYHEMDPFRVPDLPNAHLAKDFDRQRPGAILSHGHVSGDDSNLTSTMDSLGPGGLDADDLLCESQRIIIEDVLGQSDQEKWIAILPLLKTERDPKPRTAGIVHYALFLGRLKILQVRYSLG